MMGKKQILLTLILTAALLAGLLPPAVPSLAQGTCGDAPPPRLLPGGDGMVSFTNGQPLNVRDAAALAAAQLGQLPEGTAFQVISGPVCAENIYWWQIQTSALGGWIAEGASGEYFVEPALPPAPMTLAGGTGPFSAWNWAALAADYWNPNVADPKTITLPAAYAGNLPALPVDLTNTLFVNDTGLNDNQRALLAQNGFVVIPAGFDQFLDAYRDPTGTWLDYSEDGVSPAHAYFVTTDATLHALHFIFDNLLTDLEQNAFLPIMMDEVLTPALIAAHQQTQDAAGTGLETAATNAELYLVVALGLFGSDGFRDYTSPEMLAAAQPIIDMALAGEGQSEIPFLAGYLEDFSQYRPRGHYAGDPALEGYFRGMMWISRITFLANDDSATQIALMLLRALQNGQGSLAGWNKVHDTLSFLIGPVDDLGPQDYAPLAKSLYGPTLDLALIADPALLAGFKAELNTLPPPRVNGIVLPDDTTAEEVAPATRGFRFLGQRFTFDGYVMQQLMYPYVGTRENQRQLPLGLDIPSAVAGSETAYQLAIEAGAGDFVNYDTQTLRLASTLGVMTDDQWLENVYSGWMWALNPLWSRASSAYPPLMNTPAWLRKDLQTGLASWTQLKHDTVLYAKQPTGFGGGGGPLTSFGYVEPNPLVFARIAIVAGMTYQGLKDRGLDQYGPPPMMGSEKPGYLKQDGNPLERTMNELRNLAFEAAGLSEIARKELAGETITEDEYWQIYHFSNYLMVLLYSLSSTPANPDPVALVTDVASNPSIGAVLQEGVGGVDYIYVVVPTPDGQLQVVRGGVFSYYEWVGDINQRMTDDEWRAKVKSGDLPARPAWVSAFYSE
ncbi:MAG: DUF3160 domain-containing protein [Chloroflexi bacterium]|nr:DUF3160 domain-containing protein [Chloroflexota bacterium]